MEALEQIAQEFFQPRRGSEEPYLKNAALGAVNRAGTFVYVDSFGEKTNNRGDEPPAPAVYAIASATKLITTIAALQCVDKGLLELDTSIGKVLPEWENPKVLTGFDAESQPILEDARSCITLRQLLTHTSGMSYAQEYVSPDLVRFHDFVNCEPTTGRTIAESYACVLIHHPGERWEYSPSIDWAGKMVECVNGGIRLGEYMQRNIFQPLGISDIEFRLEERHDMQVRTVQCYERSDNGNFNKTHWSMRSGRVIEDFGGGGLYAPVPDLLKIYSAMLRQDSRILSPQMFQLMFTPQLKTKTGLDCLETKAPFYTNSILNSVPLNTPVSFGLGGLLNIDSVEGRRGTLSLTWSGMTNCYWWVDHENGIAGVYLSQLLPPGDSKAVQFLAQFEEMVYKMVLPNGM